MPHQPTDKLRAILHIWKGKARQDRMALPLGGEKVLGPLEGIRPLAKALSTSQGSLNPLTPGPSPPEYRERGEIYFCGSPWRTTRWQPPRPSAVAFERFSSRWRRTSS